MRKSLALVLTLAISTSTAVSHAAAPFERVTDGVIGGRLLRGPQFLVVVASGPRDVSAMSKGQRYERVALDSIPHPRPGIALALSAVGVLAPLAAASFLTDVPARGDGVTFAVLSCAVFSPSAGYFYAGLTRRALLGASVRATGFAIFIAAGMSGQPREMQALTDATSTRDQTFGPKAVGLLMMLGAGLIDVATVAEDVERANAERAQHRVNVGVRPLPSGKGPALAVTLRF